MRLEKISSTELHERRQTPEKLEQFRDIISTKRGGFENIIVFQAQVLIKRR